MQSGIAPELDIHYLIENRGVATWFQPLVSIKRGTVFGVEALSRGLMNGSRECIPPQRLFSLAHERGAGLALDRLCREKALEAFAPLHLKNRGLMISLNVDASTINHLSVGSQRILNKTKSCGINPNNVILEIIESEARDIDSLMEFVSYYRRHGFIIALDDVGAGYSNLDRIPQLKPDMLKLDRSLVSDVDRHFHKLEVVKSLVRMANRTGALVLAEGVERLEEAVELMEAGVDVFQGYHFGRPEPAEPDFLPDYGPLEKRIQSLSSTFKVRTMVRLGAEKKRFAAYDAMMAELCGLISREKASNIDQTLTGFLDSNGDIECLYVLNLQGVQVSSTICNPGRLKKSMRFVYEPANCGTDHSLKEYYLPIRAGLDKFTTEPYISLASGNRCITISAQFNDFRGQPHILCADIGQG